MTTNERRTAHVVAALLCLGVAAVHIEDQGGLSALADPTWIGWGYRLIEIASIVVAGALVFAAGADWSGWKNRLTWVAALLLGTGPFLGYVLTRTSGLPQATDDVGNWSEPTGVASLIIEGLLIVLAAGMVVLAQHRPSERADVSASPGSADAGVDIGVSAS